MKVLEKETARKVCNDLLHLLSNRCEFIFTEDKIYDAIERNVIDEVIYEYMESIEEEE